MAVTGLSHDPSPVSASQMSDQEHRSKILSLLLHMADISHPCKPWVLHHRWTSRLLEEFFQQGDREREAGRECSPLCDRNNILVPESQIGMGEICAHMKCSCDV